MPRFVIYEIASGEPLRAGLSNHCWRSLIGGEDLHYDFDNEDRFAPFEHAGQGIIEVGPDFDFYNSRIEAGQVVITEAPLDRDTAMAAIDRDAEQVRARFITPGSGQAMVYQQKAAEAELVVADLAIGVDTPSGNVPHIAAEAEQYGISLYDQAVVVLTMREQWKAVSAVIEIRRLAAKDAVRFAETAAAIEAAKIIDWSDLIPA